MPCVVDAAIIKFLVFGEKAVVCCFDLSLGVNGSKYANPFRLFSLLFGDVLDTAFSSQVERVRDCRISKLKEAHFGFERHLWVQAISLLASCTEMTWPLKALPRKIKIVLSFVTFWFLRT